MTKHVALYIPGIGDSKVSGRRLLIAGWRLYGLQPVVHQVNWADKRPFTPKLQSLLEHIDRLVTAGNRVSLVGESAGASAAMIAYAGRQDVVHRVVCLCGKLRNAETISRSTYEVNPAFAESMAQLPGSLAAISAEKLARVCSIHPLFDTTVPVPDTVVDGTQSKTILSVGHATSIVLGNTLFSWTIASFLRKP